VQQLPTMVRITSSSSPNLKIAAACLKSGNLVAFPTETVYGLGADATNQAAISDLYRVKNRPTEHPLIVHISSLASLGLWAVDTPHYAIKLARSFWPGPMTLILRRSSLAKDFITGNQNNVGIRIPGSQVAIELLKEFEAQGGLGIAAPSANRFGKVSPTTAGAVSEELSEFLSPSDMIIDGGDCQIGLESTIINCTDKFPVILRPGAITASKISELIGLDIEQITKVNDIKKIRASGLLRSHYSPQASVFISAKPQPGDGLIALSFIPTPNGVIRLASPLNDDEYAKVLYKALRLADSKQIKRVIVVPPLGEGIAMAIRDRLERCSTKFE
jgi:L-threonylcarbamoyladenylate synthase